MSAAKDVNGPGQDPKLQLNSGTNDILERVHARLLSVLHESLPLSKELPSAVREAVISSATQSRYVAKCTLDSGASHGNYVGRAAFAQLEFVQPYPCKHSARLGDGKTLLSINEAVELNVQVYREDHVLSEPIATQFFIVESLGEEMIIGLPDLVGSYFDLFAEVLENAAGRLMPSRQVNEIVKFS